MSIYNSQKVIELIASFDEVVNFGNAASAVGDEWVKRAEDRLNIAFTNSYKWFLMNYGGGEIGGEEIYSVYGEDFDSIQGGDIVAQHLAGLRNGLVDDMTLVVSETDFGEVFFFDFSEYKSGECPIKIRMPSGDKLPYARDFYEFLCKRILAHI